MSLLNLLQRSEALANQAGAAKVNAPIANLKGIFLASEEICKRRQLRSDVEWKEKDLRGGDAKLPAVHSDPTEALSAASASYVDEYVTKSLERAKVEAERAFINQKILEQANSNPYEAQKGQGWNAGAGNVDPALGQISNKVADYQQEVFAKNISKFLSANNNAVEPAIVESLKTLKCKEANQIWGQVLPLLEIDVNKGAMDLASYRASEAWVKHVLNKSTAYLQAQFKEHMETVVENNLSSARRGGVPGTMSLIEAYLNVTLTHHYSPQDSQFGKHPAWAVLFNFIRVGDLSAASTVAKTLQNLPNCSILVSCILNLANNISFDVDRRMKLDAEWKHEVAHCTDQSKRALYVMFLGGDCPEVTDSIEAWLWLKLMCCKLDVANGRSQFHKLQTTVCVDCGEDYFVSGSGNFLLYFSALWMTGQVERAIQVLHKAGLTHHAVHIAVLAYQKKLLLLTPTVADPILKQDGENRDPVVCNLNFARLILLYVKNFELVNVDYALCYAFFLRFLSFNVEGMKEGNIFESYVSRLCYVTAQTDLILGKLTEQGASKPGLIEKFKDSVNIADVISRVAADSDVSGDALTACRLYLLTGKPTDAFKICSKHLANFMTSASGESESLAKTAEETLKLAHWLQNLYMNKETPALQESAKMELDALIKLNLFYGAVRENPLEALRIIKSLKILPLAQDELMPRTADFVRVSDQVKAVLHNVVLALLEVAVFLANNSSAEGPSRAELKNMVRVVLLFVSQVNCRFPAHVNTKILQLQSQI